MTSLFASWIGPSKLSGDAEQGPTDPGRPRVTSSGNGPMSPIDRATSMTPKAHFQYGSEADWSSRDHHREASEATLNGRSIASSEADHLSMRSHPYDGSVVKPSASRPTSMSGPPNELSHERLSALGSTLGGVNSEAAWSAAAPSEAARSSMARRRKKIAPPELLVIVKPPPSKQSNPLNLQIQLVMPQQLQNRRESSQRRASMESSAAGSELPTTPSTELRRRDSIGSTRSAGSEISTSGSVASASSGRRVTPLYNLNFHHILSTTVSDAGTDQKVAKYVKKGIDLDGFGILEPAELIHGVNDLATLQKKAATGRESLTVQAGNATNISPRSETDSSGGAVDNGSAFSAPAREVAGSAAAASSNAEPPTSFEAMTPEARGVEGNLGGKLLGKFKRFSLGVRPNSAAGGAGGSVFGRDSNVPDRTATGGSAPAPSLFGKLSQHDAVKGHNTGDIPQMHPGAGVHDGKRTEGYFWTVRKWNRRPHETHALGRQPTSVPAKLDLEGSNPVLTSVWKRFNMVNRMGGNEIHPPPSSIPVRFEWSRNSRKSSTRRQTAEAQARLRSSLSLNASVTSVDRHTGEASRSNVSLPRQPNLATTQSLGVDQTSSPRLSTGDAARTSRPASLVSGTGHRSPRRSLESTTAGSTIHHGDEDSGDESDPEDSETPWNCHLVLGPTTRIPLGTLSPAPHHPKLVGQLAVPFPLPDLSGTGLGPDGAGLTREELKDVIIVTCLHLIVRESFGGLARRKSAASAEIGTSGTAASMANVNGWRLASIPKKG
ncbi:hypothetical protein PSEUBRA_005043 [Kalmanozyma brasiliensis GHG001]|uniref:Uncharacterized protein n=1 Tax=Kalmanozyma brasiliensis (strain GHG001) TaxID=1365824 RepID=V5ESP1_KALBG|nr:uncharacterized protein PSEUBRA_005043 [Kalmanozyma brasiliensis GHG001]EST05988.1 hypothetical protein PSEUBRA_005043 [Kalmanozyma brasiliensis GHG001]